MLSVSDIVATERYPVHDPEAPRYRQLLSECIRSLEMQGCCVIQGFVRIEALREMQDEAVRVADKAHRSQEWHNPYFSASDPDLGSSHPVNCMQKRTNGFVPFDCLDREGFLNQFYRLTSVSDFVARAFGKDQLYPYADPLAAMPINVMGPGDVFPWHFDTNEFTLTVMLQEAELGGEFEYVPELRTPFDERYSAVEDILQGSRSRVRTARLRAGDIQLFKGRFALHRVTEVEGNGTRLIAIPSWAEQPGMMGKPHRTRYLYGRITPEHLSHAAQSRNDTLSD